MTATPPKHGVRVDGIVRIGIASWSVIGVVIVATMAVGLLAAVSEIVLPLVFAVLLGAATYPLARRLQRLGLKPAIASLVVVVGMIGVAVGVVLMTVKAVIQETGELTARIDDALADLATSGESSGLSAENLQRLRDAVGSIAGVIGKGLMSSLVGGVGAIVGLVTGVILAMLILYYVLKDGPELRDWMVQRLPDDLQGEAASFISESVRSVRGYWAGRSVVSASVTVVIVLISLIMGLPLIATIAVVNFLGGFVPYIGAFIGGGLATVLALSEGGVGQAMLMLALVLACNLLLENLIEPKVMGDRLRIHPLLVLIATAAGGVIGGIVGLILAVPVTVITIDLLRRLHRLGAFSEARARTEPLLREALTGDVEAL